jgi:PRC-barrel domain
MQNVTAGPGTAESTGTTGSSGIATDETEDLISSSKVEGTAVYNHQGERLGTISSLMVNKFTGQMAYTIMSFGASWGSASAAIRCPGEC